MKQASESSVKNNETHKYIIIGTGFSGMGMAIRLLQSGEKDFIMLDRAAEVGGTWRDNTYPGCACDIPSHLYSFSFDQNPNWSRLYSSSQEIQEYLVACAGKFNLRQYIRFNNSVNEMRFDEKADLWSVTTKEGVSYTARFVVAATGPLNEPIVPKVKGLKDFDGPVMHSGEWDHSVSLQGKKVAVIGTGASAGQIVPAIAGNVGELAVFQRTPPWVLPRKDRKISSKEKQVYRLLPFALDKFRQWIYARLEVRGVGFTSSPFLMKLAEKGARSYLKKQIEDPELRKKVTPDYAMGCKRILMSDDYYPALTRENVSLYTGGLNKIEGNTLYCDDGSSFNADVLILGTGFHGNKPLFGVDVFGVNGRSLQSEWGSNGPEGYYGVGVSGYPNFFTIHGPNTGLGHNSVVIMLEAQINLIKKIVDFTTSRGKTRVDVKPNIQESFNEDIQKRLSRAVWQEGGCHSWYQLDNGKNVVIWPGLTYSFIKETEAVSPDNFNFGLA